MNVSSVLQTMRVKQYFADVTLACENGHQIDSHKVILTASRPLFSNLLKKTKYPHTLICMRGMNCEEHSANLDFLSIFIAQIAHK